MSYDKSSKYNQEVRYPVTIYTSTDSAKLMDMFFKENRKWKKGGFFLEAALEKIERERSLKQRIKKIGESHGNTHA